MLPPFHNDGAIRAALTHAKRVASAFDEVHAVDYGYAYHAGVRMEHASVRFHVRKKIAKSAFKGSLFLPTHIESIPVDVIESGYRVHLGDPRSQQPKLSPGLSIGNLATSETGTLGALVRGPNGETFILSNWHVLAAGATIGDQIVQPGPMHLGPDAARAVGILDRSLLPSEQFDAALARVIDGFPIEPTLFNLGFEANSVVEPTLGMRLTKSGAVSGITEAVVDGVDGSYKLDYSSFGLGQLWMRGFRLVKDRGSTSVSISEPGDSGSLWVDVESKAAVGIHFGGESDDSPLNDFALAHPLNEVLRRLGVQLLC